MTTLNKLINKKYALVAPREDLEMILISYPSIGFRIAREGLISTVGNFAIRKTLDTKYKNKLSKLFQNLYYFGIETKIKKFMPLHIYAQLNGVNSLSKLITSPDVNKLLTKNSHLRTSNVKTFLYIYLIGIAISTIIFICETIAIIKNKCSKSNLIQNNINF